MSVVEWGTRGRLNGSCIAGRWEVGEWGMRGRLNGSCEGVGGGWFNVVWTGGAGEACVRATGEGDGAHKTGPGL